jgi:hypothetical protein
MEEMERDLYLCGQQDPGANIQTTATVTATLRPFTRSVSLRLRKKGQCHGIPRLVRP